MKGKNIQNPLDPSGNEAEMLNDTSGLTGITTNINKQQDNDDDIASIKNSSTARFKMNEELGFESDDPDKQSNSLHTNKKINLNNQEQNKTLTKEFPPNVKGEQEISGDMPDPASDDDTLENAHKAGIALNEDEEHPQELDIGGDIDKAEEYKRTH